MFDARLLFNDGLGELVGRITSIAPRSTLGYPIAMALLRPDLAQVGTTVKIRVDRGSIIEAVVASMPFYDPDNTRQSTTFAESGLNI